MVHFIPLSAIANLCLFWLYMSIVHSASESIPNEVKELLSQNHGKESLELFQNSFDTYQAIVNNDYLEHKSMTQSLTNILNKYVSLSQPKDLAIADLGCGDLALLNHIYKKLPISTFTGVDASLPALEIAKTRLLSSLVDPMTFNWVNGDLLDWAQSHIDNNHKTQQYYDIIICAYSVHHLLDDIISQTDMNINSNKTSIFENYIQRSLLSDIDTVFLSSLIGSMIKHHYYITIK